MAILPDEEQYTGQPWIAQCTSTPVGDKLDIQWLKGPYTRPWSPDRRYKPCDISTDNIICKVEFYGILFVSKFIKRKVER